MDEENHFEEQFSFSSQFTGSFSRFVQVPQRNRMEITLPAFQSFRDGHCFPDMHTGGNFGVRASLFGQRGNCIFFSGSIKLFVVLKFNYVQRVYRNS